MGQLNASLQAPVREQALLELSTFRVKQENKKRHREGPSLPLQGPVDLFNEWFSHLYHIWKDKILDAEEAVLRGDV